MASEDHLLMQKLQDLQKQLGKKNMFEEAVSSITSLLRETYPSASSSVRKSIYSLVCRVATILQTRYTAPGFWLVGSRLFEEAERMVTVVSEREHLKTCIARAREHLHEIENRPEVPESSQNNTSSRFLFEGHLTVGPEPPPPAWLVAGNSLRFLSAMRDSNAIAESGQGPNNNTSERISEFLQELINGMQGNRLENLGNVIEALSCMHDLNAIAESLGQGPNNNTSESATTVRISEFLQELINGMQENRLENLANVIQASLQEHGSGPQMPPPASKEVVAKLPVITVTDEIMSRLGSETQCPVCKENLVIDDKMQELPCKHFFHPDCLKPWLDKRNSCPICRHELQTDDHAYESKKEREKEAEEERKGAANAVRGGEYMYV